MRRPLFALLPLLLLPPLSVRSAGDAPDSERPDTDAERDADQPLGHLAPGEYLRLREAHIARLRGLPHEGAETLRAAAIEALQARETARAGSLTAASAYSPTWTPIGPAPLPNGQTNGVVQAVSGRVSAIVVHPTNPNTVYVGTAQGGVLRTLDGGATWTPLMDLAQSLAIGALALDPITPTTLWVGTGEANFSADSFFGVGLYRIINADTTPILEGPLGGTNFSGRAIAKLIVDPNNGNNLFVASTSGIGGISGSGPSGTLPNRGVYRSTNALGASPTFTQLTVPTANLNRNVSDLAIDPSNANNLVAAVFGTSAAGDGGIWVSTNALTTAAFTRVLTLGTASNGNLVKMASNRVGVTVTLLIASDETPGGCTNSGTLRVSTNIFGATPTFTTLAAANGFCGGQCFYDEPVTIDPNNASIIYLGGSAVGSGTCASHILQKSINGGTSFSLVETGLHSDSHAITIAPSTPTTLFFGSDGGVWRSADSGSTWTSRNTATFSATQFQSLATHPSDPQFMIGGTQDNGTECLGPCGGNPAGAWNRADFGDGGFSLIDQNAVNTTTVTMYHTYFNQTSNLIGFARVTTSAAAQDNGWSFLGCGGTANGIACTDNVLFYAPMALGPGNPNTLYFGTDRLRRSSNSGTSMSLVSQAPLLSGSIISAIGISRQNDNVRIVGMDTGKVFSTTTGSSTLTASTSALFPAAYVARAVIDPNNSNTAYVTFSGFGIAGKHVWRNTNLSGTPTTWTAMDGTGANVIPDVPVNAFVVDPKDSQVLYAGTDIGVYYSYDGGTSWLPFSNGLPRVAIFDLAIQPGAMKLRAATHGRGIWEAPLCGLPAGLFANASDASGCATSGINVGWSTPTDWGDHYTTVVRNFTVQRDGVAIASGGCAGTFAAGAIGCTDSPGDAATHSYAVIARNTCSFTATAAGGSAADLTGSNPAGFANNGAADASTCLASGNTVTWSAPSGWNDNGSGTRSFDVLRGGSPLVTGLAASATSYTDTTAVLNTAYTYAVRANNGCALTSTTAGATATDLSDATPPAMSTLYESKSGGNLVLDWTAGAPADGALYRNYSAVLPNPASWSLQNSSAATSWSDGADLGTATSLYFTTTALDACGNESPQ